MQKFWPGFYTELALELKLGGVQTSMDHEVPWKTGRMMCHLVTSRPLIFLQKEAILSPCIFATHEMEHPFATAYREKICEFASERFSQQWMLKPQSWYPRLRFGSHAGYLNLCFSWVCWVYTAFFVVWWLPGDKSWPPKIRVSAHHRETARALSAQA